MLHATSPVIPHPTSPVIPAEAGIHCPAAPPVPTAGHSAHPADDHVTDGSGARDEGNDGHGG